MQRKWLKSRFFPILGQKLYFFLPKFREHYDKMHCLCKLMVLELYIVQKHADNDVILVHDVLGVLKWDSVLKHAHNEPMGL